MSQRRIADCPLAHAVEVIGDWRTMEILHEFFEGRSGLTELERNLGVSPSRLALDLERMASRSLTERIPSGDENSPPEHRLTSLAVSLRPILIMLVAWANRQLEPDERSMRLVEAGTGFEVEPVVMDRGTQVGVEDPQRYIFVPGPAASNGMLARFSGGSETGDCGASAHESARRAGAPSPQ
jgi:DNA-binding HxlR family transcriptional regulator